MNTVLLPLPTALDPELMIDKNDQEMRSRLLKLGTDKFVDGLISMAACHRQSAIDVIYNLAGTPQEKLEWTKYRLKKLREDPGFDAERFESEAELILRDVLSQADANSAVSIILSFYDEPEDSRILLEDLFSDASYWRVAFPMLEQLRAAVDPDFLGSLMLEKLKKNDDCGWVIFKNISRILPDDVLRRMAYEIDKMSKSCKFREQYVYGAALEDFAEHLKDDYLNERVIYLDMPEFPDRVECEIADYYLGTNRPDIARSWIEKAVSRNQKLDRFLLLAYRLFEDERFLLVSLVLRAKLELSLKNERCPNDELNALLDYLQGYSGFVQNWLTFENHKKYMEGLVKNKTYARKLRL
jgi:hypothetical protein